MTSLQNSDAPFVFSTSPSPSFCTTLGSFWVNILQTHDFCQQSKVTVLQFRFYGRVGSNVIAFEGRYPKISLSSLGKNTWSSSLLSPSRRAGWKLCIHFWEKTSDSHWPDCLDPLHKGGSGLMTGGFTWFWPPCKKTLKTRKFALCELCPKGFTIFCILFFPSLLNFVSVRMSTFTL